MRSHRSEYFFHALPNIDYLSSVLSQLSTLHNFTVESQVQFHAPLAFDPPRSLSANNELQHILGDEELKMFINSADWTLGQLRFP
jgi:GPI-anchor transamidase subunit S